MSDVETYCIVTIHWMTVLLEYIMCFRELQYCYNTAAIYMHAALVHAEKILDYLGQ